VYDIASSGALELLAVSLDTEDVSTGDTVRGLTRRALAGLNAALEGRVGTSTRIGVYVVLTRRNIDRIGKLFDFLDNLGVDYVNVQPVYLPVGHSQREALGISVAERHRVAEVMEELSSHSFDCTVPSIRSMAVERLGLPPAPVNYCFAAAGDYAYISSTGVTFGCPAKPQGVEIGRVFHNRAELAAILEGRRSRSGACDWQCGDCLGMYEMASRRDVVPRHPHVI
jgi:MoaA/NifB/PqqE/SkfB family radical SAM enzyme